MREFFAERTLISCIAVAAVIGVLTALIAHAYIGSFSRFISDDYCTAAKVEKDGFWGAQQYWFTQWSGRFSFTAAISLAHYVGGPKVVPFVPGILLACWLIAASWALTPIIPTRSRISLITGPVLLAGIIIASTLATTPTIYESLYWETGAIT